MSENTYVFIAPSRTSSASVRQALIEEFPDEVFLFASDIGLNGRQASAMDRLIESAKHRAHRFYCGHMAFGVDCYFEQKVSYFTIYRDPVDRILSLHDALSRIGAITAKIEDWIDTAFDARNGMVKRLCGFDMWKDLGPFDFRNQRLLNDDFEVGPEHLEQAKQTVDEHIELVLSQGHFPENSVLLQRYLGSRALFSLYNQNMMAIQSGSRRAGANSIEVELIENRNVLDVALYDYLEDKFEKQLLAGDSTFEHDIKTLATIEQIISDPDRPQIDFDIFRIRFNEFVESAQKAGANSELLEVVSTLAKKPNLGQSYMQVMMTKLSNLTRGEKFIAVLDDYKNTFGVDEFTASFE